MKFVISFLRSRAHHKSPILEARTGHQSSNFGVIAELKECISSRDLNRGKKLHAFVVERGQDSQTFVANALVDMYAKCGSVVDARTVFNRMLDRSMVSWNALMLGYTKSGEMAEAQRVFDKMARHSVVSWTTLIQGYVENQQEELALEVFSFMKTEGCVPDARTFVALSKACSGLAVKEEGRQIGSKIVKVESLNKGMAVHSQAANSGCKWDIFLANSLMDMYSKCGSMIDARIVFDRVPQCDVVSWNTLMLGYCENGEEELVLRMFEYMGAEGCCSPDSRSYVAALKACAALASKEEGTYVDGRFVKLRCSEKATALHSRAVTSGCNADIYVVSSLINLYAKCGRMVDAQRVFDASQKNDLVSWNALMLGYIENGEAELALELFGRNCHAADSLVFMSVFKACTSLAITEEAKEVDGKLVKLCSLERGLAFHSQAVKCGYDLNIFVASTLVDMYMKCGSLLDARKTFDGMPSRNVVSWNALMLGYAENGEAQLGLSLFKCMRAEGLTPDTGSFIAAVKSCVFLATMEQGKWIEGKVIKLNCWEEGAAIHSQAAKCGCDSDSLLASSLVDMYAKCGSLVDAQEIFDRMPRHDTVSWTALISGYVESGHERQALELFSQMRLGNCAADSRTFATALKACGSLAGLAGGKAIYADICKSGLEKDLLLVISLVDFYGKCGSMVHAQQLFDSSYGTRVVTWNALLAGYSRLGDASRVSYLFQRMLREGIKADDVTFICLLTACSHAGHVKEGKEYFRAMSSKYGIDPGLKHYICMVDMLGRANELEEAMDMVNKMPLEPNAVAWTSILAACSKWKDLVLGKVAFESLLRIDERKAAAYGLMSNMLTTDDTLGGSGLSGTSTYRNCHSDAHGNQLTRQFLGRR